MLRRTISSEVSDGLLSYRWRGCTSEPAPLTFRRPSIPAASSPLPQPPKSLLAPSTSLATPTAASSSSYKRLLMNGGASFCTFPMVFTIFEVTNNRAKNADISPKKRYTFFLGRFGPTASRHTLVTESSEVDILVEHVKMNRPRWVARAGAHVRFPPMQGAKRGFFAFLMGFCKTRFSTKVLHYITLT